MRFGILTIIGIAVAVAGGLALLVSQLSPTADRDAAPRIMYVLLLIMLFGSSLVAARKTKLSEHMRNLVLWLVIVLVLVTLYAFRDEFATVGGRVAGTLLPSVPQVAEDGTVTLERSANGHFMARLDVEVAGRGAGTVPVYFMVDTGATSVSLTKRDAERLGFDTAKLNFNMPVNTANGVGLAAPVTLGGIVIGDRTVFDISASVMENGTDVSLLGLSFLDKLSSYRVERDRLILHP